MLQRMISLKPLHFFASLPKSKKFWTWQKQLNSQYARIKKKEKKNVGESVFFLAISLTLLGEMSSMIVKIDALAGSQLCYICCSLYTLHTVYATVPTESPKKCGDQ